MKISAQQYAQALHQTLQQTPDKDQDKVIDNLIKVLQANQHTDLYQEIIEEFEKLLNKDKGLKEVKVTTATDQDSKVVMDNLNELAGKQIKLTHQTDESIIGGVVIKMDDTLIDGSIKTQLDDLHKQLKE